MRLSETVLKKRLAGHDDTIARAREVLDNAQLDLEVAVIKKKNFARNNCPHTQTFKRSLMGRDEETRCALCDLEV